MNGFLYALYLAFFVSHIPITLFVDSQAVLPAQWYPQAALDMQAWYFDTYKDPLMMGAPIWFKSLVCSELALQLPFFFVAIYAFVARKNWIRIPAILYGSFVSATMVPILAELAMHTAPGYQRTMVTAFYLPYLLVPLTLALHMAATPQPFGRAAGKAKRQ